MNGAAQTNHLDTPGINQKRDRMHRESTFAPAAALQTTVIDGQERCEAPPACTRPLMQTELHMLGACMEHLNDIVVVTSIDMLDEPGPAIVYVNQAFVTKTGYSREEVIGRSPRFLQGPATDRAQLDAIRTAMKLWRPITVELINYKKNGEPFWLELSLAPIADSSGWFTHWVAIERDIDERKRTDAAIQQLVNFDPLTGLPNRRMLLDRLALALSASKRSGHNGALLFIDLDNFKNLNDTEGHHVGDELLKQAAQRLVAIVRLEDTVARLGGDEFVVMLGNLNTDAASAANAAQHIAEKIIGQLALPYDLVGQSYSSTASLGISLFHEIEQQRSVQELLTYADFAMYQSKAAGRNTWRFFDPKTQATLVEKNALEADLKHAFATRQLSLHYQPIVDANRTVVGVEALMRWYHPTRGWVAPLEFIPIAESTGLIVPMGKWAIAGACALLKTWSADPQRAGWSIAVNVSARQIRQADFVEVVAGLIADSGCTAALLKLELTESLLQHDFDATIAKMDTLRTIGVAFSIDDFGTGYSSLAYLQRLPISVLKIDRSFVHDIGHDEGDESICKMILALGKTLGLSIVAEGVETLEQYDFLKAHHCDTFQGYLFGQADATLTA
jgi:diguanylate cyclase (GGDEF)-like protein/PAS domain S-box-containing protein